MRADGGGSRQIMADHLREGHQDDDDTMAFGTLSGSSAVELRCVTTDMGANLIDEEVDCRESVYDRF